MLLLALALGSKLAVGAISDVPRAAHLLEGQTGLEDFSQRFDVEGLRLEYAKLLKRRPSIGPGVTLVATGGGVVLSSLVYLAVSLSAFTLASPLLILAIIGLSGGALMAGLGVVVLVYRTRDREVWELKVEAMKERLEQLESGQGGPPLPPLPPTPSSVPQVSAGRMLELARF